MDYLIVLLSHLPQGPYVGFYMGGRAGRFLMMWEGEINTLFGILCVHCSPLVLLGDQVEVGCDLMLMVGNGRNIVMQENHSCAGPCVHC